MVPSETQVLPVLDERALNLGYLSGVCDPLPSPGPYWLLGRTVIRSVTTLFLIILYLSFLFSNLLAVTSQQYPPSILKPVELRERMLVEGKGESTRLDTAAEFQGRCWPQLLNLDCEVFPFIFEMGVDAFCTMLSKRISFPLTPQT